MKTPAALVLAGLLVSTACCHALDDLVIAPTRKKLDQEKERTSSNTSQKSKEIAYSVKVSNRSSNELRNVTIKYNIYYEDNELGSKFKGDVKTISGSHVIASLLNSRPVDFDTKSVELTTAALDSGWYFKGGGKPVAKDRVVGIWFRAFDAEGKQIAEYANPPTVPKKQKWVD
jgi:hypothetical protein